MSDRLPETSLGEMLHDAAMPMPARLAMAWQASESSDPAERARAVCWLAYRLLDGIEQTRDAAAMVKLLKSAVFQLGEERNAFLRARWRVSLMMVLGYVEIVSGEGLRGESLAGLDDLNLLRENPSGVVNVCRGLALLAALRRGEPRVAGLALKACEQAFRFGAASLPLRNVHACAGLELASAARAMQIAVALAPHCGQPYQGAVTLLADLAAMEPAMPFQGALKMVLGV